MTTPFLATVRDLEVDIPGFRRILLLFALLLGAAHAWAAASAHSMNADGISYLDIGDAFWRGEWQSGLSAMWSPLYPLIQGFFLRIVNPPMRWEFPTVHLVNYLIYIFALICFDYFWRQVIAYHQTTVRTAAERTAGWPNWALLAIGYLLFISSALVLVEIWSVTPDMLMAGFVYLASALILRLRLGQFSWRTSLLLGIVLSLSYLTKEIMLPVSALFLCAALFSGPIIRTAVTRLALAAIILLVVVLSYSALFSSVKGKPAFGQAALFTYAKHVNGIPFAHWQGTEPGSGVPLHPTRRLLDDPPLYEFAAPVAGTYPISYDPFYWNEGLRAHFDFEQQLDALVRSALFYFDLFAHQYSALLFAILLLYLLRGRRPAAIRQIVARWGLAIVAFAVFAFYAIVLVEGRYIGAFVVIFWADLLANATLARSEMSRTLFRALSGIIVIVMLAGLLAFNLSGYQDFAGSGQTPGTTSLQARAPRWPGEVAEELQRQGLGQGDPVGVIGYAFDSYWARLARVKIVAEMPGASADSFWVGDRAYQDRAVAAFAAAGVKAIVAESVPEHATLPGWRQISNTNYYLYTVKP